MAKRKLTAKQRKARKRASYIRSEYYKNFDALQYLKDFAKVKDIKIPNKITKRSLEAIRKKYKEVRSSIQQLTGGGYMNPETGEYLEKLPTKKEMVKEVRREQPYREDRAQGTEAPAEFNPDLQYLEELRSKIYSLTPLRDSDKTDKNYQKNVVPKFEEARNRIIGAIDYAIAKAGAEEIAQLLAGNNFIQRIANLEEKYTHEIVESIDDDLVPLIEASVDEALEAY